MMCVFPIFPAVLVMWCTKDCSFMVQKIHIRLFGLLKKYHDISKYPATNKKGEGGSTTLVPKKFYSFILKNIKRCSWIKKSYVIGKIRPFKKMHTGLSGF